MDDAGKLLPSNGTGRRDPVASRDCSVCHESWNIPPTSKEIKSGVVEPVMVCLHKATLQVMSDGSYPRLATVCRSDKKLCGGNLWTPIGPPLIADVKPWIQLRAIKLEPKANEEVRKKGPYGRRPRQEEGEGEGEGERRRKKNDKVRRPYKVTE